MIRKVSLFFTLIALWLLMSGHYNPITLGLGLLSIILTLLISVKMGVVDGEGLPVELLFRAPRYAAWLLWEVVLSNIAVVREICSVTPVNSGIQHFDTTGLDDLGRVIYANSITLTPGTLTIDIVDDSLIVHALNEQSLVDMAEGSMYFQVDKLIGHKAAERPA